MYAHALTHTLGGAWRNGRGQAPCPVCQPERRRDQIALSISEANGKILLFCFKRRCSFIEIANAISSPLENAKIDVAARRETERKQAEYSAAKLAKARSLWDAAKPIAGTKAEAYLRGRGITAPLPDSLRFMPDIYHAPSSTWSCAMVANVEPIGGVHRTFLSKKGARLPKSAKLMLGPCAGGAVRLSEGVGPLVVAEGIETALSLLSGLLSGPASVWAALSTSGIKALQLPPDPGKLIVATDGDAPGREAGNVLASRASALGWKVSLLPAPDGSDWNDVLQSGERAA
ncbi:virulence-associated protein E [Rhodobacteraceae bacterium R_SAG10]|nr:virulence-associated protein E [Rhodobacteraceae bacterium R_SAG10]